MTYKSGMELRVLASTTTGFSAGVGRLIEELDKPWRIPRLMEKLAIFRAIGG